MRVLSIFLLTLMTFSVSSKSIIIMPNNPDGSFPLWSYEPTTKFEGEAFSTLKKYLEDNNKKSNYYIITHGLNVSTGLYHFKLQDPASFGTSDKLIFNKSYNNVIAYYDVKSNKIVNTERWKK